MESKTKKIKKDIQYSKEESIEKTAHNSKKIAATIFDLIAIFILVSIVHLIIITIFKLSPNYLLRQGIETSVFEEKMQFIAYLGFCYVAIIIAYFLFFRKYFSLGNKIFKR